MKLLSGAFFNWLRSWFSLIHSLIDYEIRRRSCSPLNCRSRFPVRLSKSVRRQSRYDAKGDTMGGRDVIRRKVWSELQWEMNVNTWEEEDESCEIKESVQYWARNGKTEIATCDIREILICCTWLINQHI
jgi:hypothetical protein